jgi:hypothetical protein
VLCVAARTMLDEAAAIMFGHLCRAHGLATRVEGAETLSTSNIFRLESNGVAVVCLSYLSAENLAHLRYAVRRVRRKLPHATIVVGLWTDIDRLDNLETPRESTKADFFATSLREASRICVELALKDAPAPIAEVRPPATSAAKRLSAATD